MQGPDLNRRPSGYELLPEMLAAECPTLPLWRGLDRVISEYLERVTLADLLEGRV